MLAFFFLLFLLFFFLAAEQGSTTNLCHVNPKMLAPSYPVHADTLCKVAREKTKKSCEVVKSILMHEMVVASLITAVKLTWLFAVWLAMASTSVPDIGLLFSF